MGKTRQSLILSILFLCACLPKLQAQTGQPKLFVFNLSSVTLDIRLQSEENKAFEARGVGSNWATRLEPVEKQGEFILYFRRTGDKQWYQWAEEPGSPTACRILPGKIHCILFTRNGEIRYLGLHEEHTQSPQVCFINLSGSLLSRMELGEGWKYNTKLELEQVADRTVTDFIPCPEGMHSFFWSYQNSDLDHFTYMNKDEASPEKFEMTENEYYLFALVSGGDADFPLVFDITPYY